MSQFEQNLRPAEKNSANSMSIQDNTIFTARAELKSVLDISEQDFRPMDTITLDRRLEKVGGYHRVYNFEVEGTHTYIADGIRVHNRSTLSFLTDENGDVTNIEVDQFGNLVVTTQSDDGGTWTITARAVDPVTGTQEVEKVYSYESDNGLFRLVQTEIWGTDENGDPEYQSVEIGDIRLGGDALADTGLASGLTPYLSSAIGLTGSVENLLGGTVIETVLQNLIEVGGNIIHHSLLSPQTNLDVVQEISETALEDFGAELTVNLTGNAISLVSQLIMAEIYEVVDFGDGVVGDVAGAFLSEGVDFLLSNGLNTVLETAGIFNAVEGLNFANPVQLLATTLFNGVIPANSTVEGSIANLVSTSFVQAFAPGVLSSLLPFAGLGALLGPVIIGAAIGALVDFVVSIFRDPEAFIDIGFDDATGEFVLSNLRRDDGGDRAIPSELGESVDTYLDQFVDALGAVSHNYGSIATVSIGYKEDEFIDTLGVRRDIEDDGSATDTVFSSLLSILRQLNPLDGDLKVQRAMDLDNFAANTAGMTSQEAFSYLYSRMRIAQDYQYYLENTQLINNILTGAVESDDAAAWLATILQANEFGLSDSYDATGDALDNMFMLGDGDDVVSGGAGNDTINAYGGDDELYGDEGDDILQAGDGADLVDGGSGQDRVSFSNALLAVGLDLELGVGTIGDAEGDTYVSIENVTGSEFGDLIRGSNEANIIDGASGDDFISGLDGDDTLNGGSGHDQVFGGLGNDLLSGDGGDDSLIGDEGDDSLYGNAGADILFGGAGQDSLFGGEGDDILQGIQDLDTFNGGDGFDIVSYTRLSEALTVNLSSGGNHVITFLDGTQYSGFVSIEAIRGSSGDDEFIGDGGTNYLIGGYGNDTLSGDDGNDTYIYTRGDGHDIIDDEYAYHGNDRLELTNIASSEIVVGRIGNDLIINVLESSVGAGDGGSIQLDSNGDARYQNGIETIIFSDGVDYTDAELRQLYIDTLSTDVDDVVDGFNSGNRFEGGLGDDTYLGGDGNDIYIYSRGDGHDYIDDEFAYHGNDRLELTDVTSSEVVVGRDGNDLIINILESAEGVGDGGSIRLDTNGDARYQNGVETIIFADGVELTDASLRQLYIDTISTDSDDIIDGFNSGDRFEGRLGDDTYLGGSGNDTYIYNRGDGHDYIDDEYAYNGNDRLELTDVTSSEVVVGRDGNDLIINILESAEGVGDGGSIRLDTNGDARYQNGVETIIFADGVELTDASLRQLYIDTISTDSDDIIDGFNSGDRFEGGLGDDTYLGGDGNDIYIYNRGDGHDIIDDEYAHTGNDRLELTNISSSEIIVSRINNDLVVNVLESAEGAGDGGSIRLDSNADARYENGIETIIFADGIEYTDVELRQLYIDTLSTDGDDVIDGFNSGDRFEGGLGNDSYLGGDGNDIYIYNRGDGHDIIDDEYAHTGNDRLELTDITSSEIIVSRINNDLVINILESAEGAGDGGSIRLDSNADARYENGIETIIFADGIEYTDVELRQLYIDTLSTDGDDVIDGFNSGDRFEGGLGNDSYLGGDGNDIYIYNRGDGHDIIDDEYAHTGNDRLELTDITSSEIIVSRINNDLVINILESAEGAGDGGSIRLDSNADARYENGIETIIFADGIEYTDVELRQLYIDTLSTDGDDVIDGFNSGDRFEGGLGNDSYLGGDGNDIYIYNRGDGHDIIDDEYAHTGNDRLELTDITSSEIIVSRINNDLVINILESAEGAGDGGSIRLDSNADARYENGIETIIFADGIEYTDVELRQLYIDTLSTDGDDVIDGFNSGDRFEGGLGNDSYLGGDGNDIYIYNRGDGHDVIDDEYAHTGNDRLELTDITSSEISLTRDGNDLIINVLESAQGAGDGGSIRLDSNADARYENGIETIIFADGVEYTDASLRQLYIDTHSTDGDDVIDGFNSGDRFEGGLGDDTYLGGDGSDSYIYTRGDGHDIIDEGGSYDGGGDRLELSGIDPSSVTIVTSGNDIFLSFAANEGQNDYGSVLLINNALTGREYGVETIVFDDGTEWSDADLRAMAVENVGPEIGSVELVTTNEDTALTFDAADLLANSSDANGHQLNVTSVSVDPEFGVIVDNGDGTYTFTPAENLSRDDIEINFTVSDRLTIVDGTAFIDVTPLNDAPIVVNQVDNQTFEEEGLVNFVIPNDVFADVDSDILTLSAELADGAELPSWLTFDGSTFSGTPPLDFSGDITVVIVASDGEFAASQSFLLSITPINDAPIVGSELVHQSSPEDRAVNFALPETAFSDIDSLELVLTATLVDGSALPEWLSFDGSIFTGLPPQDFYGTFDIRVIASDGEFEVEQEFALEISPQDEAPVVQIVLENQSFDEDSIVSFTLPSDTFTDADSEVLTLTATLASGVSLPEWLSFDGSSFTGTPPQDFNGDLEIFVSATDGVLSANQTFVLSIAAFNDATVVGVALLDQSSMEDEAVEFILPADAFLDADGDTLTLTARLADGNDIPSWLSFNGESFTGIPPQDFNGNLDIIVSATDGEFSVSQSFVLSVAAVNDATIVGVVLANQSSLEDEAVAFMLPADAFLDADDEVLTLTATLVDGSEIPSWLFFDGVSFTGTPPRDFNGNMEILVTATDGEYSASQNFILSITPVDDSIPSNGDDTLEGTSGDDFLYALDGDDILDGGTGDDILNGGEGSDELNGGDGSDTVDYRNSNSGVTVNFLAGTASGGEADGDSFSSIENAYGSNFTDNLSGDNSANSLSGFDGDDMLEGGGGGDVLNGGDGIDTAVYTNSTNRVSISLLADTATGAQATGDVLISIENLSGSNFGDDLRGDNGGNVLNGNAGRDVLIGYNGDDGLYGGAGRDVLNGGAGADIIDGGAGVDQARYNGSTAAVHIDLLAGTASGGHAEGDTLIGIENLFGSIHDDTLYGDGNNNRIFGHNGDDALAAGGGISKLYGGNGYDTFVLSDGFAFVMDFVNDVDQLDVSGYGFSTMEEALLNLDQVGNHARFRFDGDVLFVLNTSVDDLIDDIIF